MLWDVVAFLFAVIVLCWQLGHSLYSCFAMDNVALSLPTLWLIFDAVFARLEKLVNNFKLLTMFFVAFAKQVCMQLLRSIVCVCKSSFSVQARHFFVVLKPWEHKLVYCPWS